MLYLAVFSGCVLQYVSYFNQEILGLNYVMLHKKLSFTNLFIANLGLVLLILFSYVANYVTNIVLARALGGDEFGEYSMVVYVVQILATISLLGLDYALVKFIPLYIYKGDWANAAGFLRYSIRFLLKSSVAVFTFGVIIAGLSYYFDEINFLPIKHDHVFFFLWFVSFIAIADFLKKGLNSFQHPYLSLILTVQFFQPLMIVMIYGLKKLGPTINLYSMMLLYLVVVIVTIIVDLIVVYFKTPKKIRMVQPEYQTYWSKSAISILISVLLINNINAIGVIISRTFSHGEFDSGTLSAIILICGFMMIAVAAIKLTLEPLLAIAAEQGKEKLQSLVNMVCLFVLSLSGVWFIIIVLYGRSLLASFNSVFVSGYVPLLILSGATLFTSVFSISLSLLKYAGGHENKSTYSTIIGLSALIIIGSITTYYYGIWGSVITMSLIHVVITLYFAYLAKESFAIRPFVII